MATQAELQAQRRVVNPATSDLSKLPRHPRLPEKFLSRFPELRQYQEEVDRWWDQVCASNSTQST